MKLVFAGSFDPPTLGHIDIINRAANLSGELIVAIMINPAKPGMFTIEQRAELMSAAVSGINNVEIICWNGMLADLCRQYKIDAILRGVRGGLEFEAEKGRAAANAVLGGPDTIFISAAPELTHVNSTLVREILSFNGDVSGFVPGSEIDIIYKYLERS